MQVGRAFNFIVFGLIAIPPNKVNFGKTRNMSFSDVYLRGPFYIVQIKNVYTTWSQGLFALVSKTREQRCAEKNWRVSPNSCCSRVISNADFHPICVKISESRKSDCFRTRGGTKRLSDCRKLDYRWILTDLSQGQAGEK